MVVTVPITKKPTVTPAYRFLFWKINVLYVNIFGGQTQT